VAWPAGEGEVAERSRAGQVHRDPPGGADPIPKPATTEEIAMPMKSLFIATGQRLAGNRPSSLRAAAGAGAAGTAVGVAVYRLLRHESKDD